MVKRKPLSGPLYFKCSESALVSLLKTVEQVHELSRILLIYVGNEWLWLFIVGS